MGMASRTEMARAADLPAVVAACTMDAPERSPGHAQTYLGGFAAADHLRTELAADALANAIAARDPAAGSTLTAAVQYTSAAFAALAETSSKGRDGW